MMKDVRGWWPGRFSGLRSNYSVHQVQLALWAWHVFLFYQLIPSSSVFALQIDLFFPTNLWYTYMLKASSACNCCMLYRTVHQLGGAGFVLANKRILANKCINLCYCCHKRIRLLTRIYGNWMAQKTPKTRIEYLQLMHELWVHYDECEQWLVMHGNRLWELFLFLDHWYTLWAIPRDYPSKLRLFIQYESQTSTTHNCLGEI